MQYHLSFHPQAQLIHVEMTVLASQNTLTFGLSQWRPGRYERQRFDKLVADVKAVDGEGNSLPVLQTSTHTWEVACKAGQEVRWKYHFYAVQRDSGNSYVDAKGIYLNPINNLMYCEGFEAAPCEVVLDIPQDWKIACGMRREGNKLFASDYHELSDSPLFASADLLHHAFEVLGVKINLWFMGECRPDLARIEHDFRAYSEAQIQLFGGCPVPEYHYLLLMLPYRFRHGVEHQTSSVNTVGPAHKLMEAGLYDSFVELCSHEFFHTWNVKALRPVDMYPYEYKNPQYSRLHYVTEGVTTYYGDLMLHKAGLYSLPRFILNFNSELNDHYLMPGKDFISLEQSSFQSWTNGYATTDALIPNRKISFYTKGFIVAFLLDYRIRRASKNQYSLDNVMHDLYQNLALQGKGYTKTDYKGLAEHYASEDLSDFFADYIEGTKPLDAALAEAGEYFGLQLGYKTSPSVSEARWGMRLQGNVVDMVWENSPAAKAGISKGDEIVAVNGKKALSAEEWIAYYQADSKVEIHLFHAEKLQTFSLVADSNFQIRIPQFTVLETKDSFVLENRQRWGRVL